MASKRRLRYKSCTRKKGVYEDEQAAWRAVRHLGPTSGIKPYKCRFCGKYHVGHLPKKVRQSIKSRRDYVQS